MSPAITITVDSRAWRAELRRLEGAAPKVLAKAINRTLDEALRVARGDLPKRFTLRTGWVGKGFRTEAATPTSLVGRLYHKDEFMALQETGGTKRGRSGGGVAVPVGARPTPGSITRPSKWPRRLQRAFAVPEDDGSVLIFQRTGRRRPRGTRRTRGATSPAPARLMYVIRPSVTLKPRWGFVPLMSRTIAARWVPNVDGYLRLALARQGL